MTALGLLFAQEFYPPITLSDIGMVVMALALILLVVERVKSLFWPFTSRNEEYVRRVELDELKTKLENFVTRLELQRLEQQLINLGQDHKELAKATNAKYDDMCKSLTDLRVTIEQVRREIHVETNAAADRIITRLIAQMPMHPHRDEEG
jgi:hypothetical protein